MKNNILKAWRLMPGWIKNKYVITSVAFLVYLMFFDSIDIPSQVKLQHQLTKLKKQTDYCRERIQEDSMEYQSTFSSMETIEKFAREHYWMKKDDEDIFVIEIK